MDVPALHVGSWFDVFQRSTLSAYTSFRKYARTEEARSSQRLIMGPWTHGHYAQPSPIVGGVDFGREAATDMLSIQIAWFDRYLKNQTGDAKDDAPVKIFVMGDNVWRDEQEWPLARTVYTDVFLHSASHAATDPDDGTLSTTRPGDEPSDHYDYDPANPVPSHGGNTMTIPNGILDQRACEERPDVLVYTGDVLDTDLELTGPVQLVLHTGSTAPDTDFIAKLVDVHPDGTAHNVVDGVLRTRFRNSDIEPELMTPGEVYELTIDMWATSYVFKAGHRIRLDITSSDFPRYDRNPNTGNAWGTDTDADLVTATQTIHHSTRHPSRLILPIVPR